MTESNPEVTQNTDLKMKAETAGVSLLRGDPKKAILKLSGPMIVAMLLMSLYNIVNAIWVAGLGSDAMAAVGFITPLFMIIMGLGAGLGAGVTSVISRRIGAEDREGADSAAVHALLLMLAISAILTVPLILFAQPIALLFGAGKTAGLAAEYGQVIFAGTVLLLFSNIGYAILRAEGDAKRTMYAMVASSLINMVLDPLLIYTAGLGIAGAAWGTLISVGFVSVVLLYWFFVKRDTYISLSWQHFKPDRAIVTDVLKVGLPASLEFVLMSALAIILNGILVIVAGTDAVAVYTAGWRVVMFAIIPVVAIGTAVTAVTGAAYGARLYKRLRVIHRFSVGFGIAITLLISVVTYVFSQQIAYLFAYAPESAHLSPTIAAFLATMCFFYPFVPPGIMSGCVFQGLGRGVNSLIVSLFRNLLFIAVFAYVLGVVLGMGEHGVWWGIVIGDILGGLLGYAWARYHISQLISLPGASAD
ncbi:MATE family efflux transporter [Methanosphaerula palustris]|uniref:MATE efflux family protein n=1 Tax=Methanosphaerula palustris (strain ATCC BAA-1556 / DSM 19958 / E1-9c) TaxID=521011 RepID=B8GJC5_METPE|nr:MATE efflux family protein [Methanosphaerula palustris E1-9c]